MKLCKLYTLLLILSAPLVSQESRSPGWSPESVRTLGPMRIASRWKWTKRSRIKFAASIRSCSDTRGNRASHRCITPGRSRRSNNETSGLYAILRSRFGSRRHSVRVFLTLGPPA
jgi:hypothetical protein